MSVILSYTVHRSNKHTQTCSALYRDLQSAPPPCDSAASWGWRCDHGRRSPCWPRWRWWPHCWARQLPGWHCGSSLLVLESEGWLELRQDDRKGVQRDQKAQRAWMRDTGVTCAKKKKKKDPFGKGSWKSSQLMYSRLSVSGMCERIDHSVCDCCRASRVSLNGWRSV